jgi:hypothetical protein
MTISKKGGIVIYFWAFFITLFLLFPPWDVDLSFEYTKGGNDPLRTPVTVAKTIRTTQFRFLISNKDRVFNIGPTKYTATTKGMDVPVLLCLIGAFSVIALGLIFRFGRSTMPKQ